VYWTVRSGETHFPRQECVACFRVAVQPGDVRGHPPFRRRNKHVTALRARPGSQKKRLTRSRGMRVGEHNGRFHDSEFGGWF
jgi:hypothetical protein